MPISWKSKIVLFNLETVYGTDSGPTGAANAILASDVRLMPMEGTDVERELDQPWFGNTGTLPAELHAKLAFKVELAPSGTAGTAPAWGVLLRACGAAETIIPDTSVTYNPVSDALESGTFHLWIGTTRYVLKGCMGTAQIELSAQAIPYLTFEFTGLFALPSEESRPTPNLTSWQKPTLASATHTPTFQINGDDFVLRSFKLDLGNEVSPRFLIGDERVKITDRADVVEARVEATALTVFDPFALAAAQTSVEIDLVHGTQPGRIAALNVPQAQLQRPQGLENAQNITEWPLRMMPLPGAGNDQWTLTLP